MYKFTAPYGKLTKYITVFTILFLAGLALFFFLMDKQISYLSTTLFILLVTILIFLSYAFSPLGYTVDHKEIKIQRIIKSIIIPLSAVKEVRFDPKAGDLKAARLFGSGGLFGYYGKFRSADLGVHDRYVTDCKKSVVIYADKTYVISPDRPEVFVGLVEGRINKK